MVLINIDYPGENGEHLLIKCFKNLRRSTNQKVNFVCRYCVTKLSFFTNMIEKSNKVSKSNVVCQFWCSGCESSYIGKTERTLFDRTKEHVTRADSAIQGHLDNCSNVEHLFSINNLILNCCRRTWVLFCYWFTIYHDIITRHQLLSYHIINFNDHISS